MTGRLLRRSDIVEAFGRLDVALGRRSVDLRVYVYGGAAMLLTFDERQATHDVDSRYGGHALAQDAIAEVARELGLPASWMNEQAASYLPREPDHDAEVIFEGAHLAVARASLRHLMALKVDACRSTDERDLELLAAALGMVTAQEALALHDEVFPDDPVTTPWKLARLEEVFDRVRQR